MDTVKDLLERTIRESEREIDGIIQEVYNISRRGKPPAGTSWNEPEHQIVARLDECRDDLNILTEECQQTLKLIKEKEDGKQAKKSCS